MQPLGYAVAAGCIVLATFTPSFALEQSYILPWISPMIGSEEVVFRWSTDRCDDDDFPDAPARSFRDHQGIHRLIAAHFDNRAMELLRDGKVTKGDCHVMLKSLGEIDPAKYADRSWISSVWTSDGLTVYAIVHHEYQANRHPGMCKYSDYDQCWYNTLVYARSDNGGRHFVQANPPDVIAAAPFRQDIDQGRPRGFFEPTNIIKMGGYWWFFAGTTGWGGQARGQCLFRTAKIEDPLAWRAWDGVGFRAQFPDPYRELKGSEVGAEKCAVLREFRFTALLNYGDRVLGVGSSILMNGGLSIFLAESVDMQSWTFSVPVLVVPDTKSSSCSDAARYAYPSLLQHETGYSLYLTRFNVFECKHTRDRDLVRFQIPDLDKVLAKKCLTPQPCSPTGLRVR